MHHDSRTFDTRIPEGVARLMQIASAEADALRLDLDDITRVRLSTEASLRRLEEEFMLCDEAGPEERARLVEELRERRLGLQTTLMTLQSAEDDAQEKLASVGGEIEKLTALTGGDDATATPQNTFAARASRAF